MKRILGIIAATGLLTAAPAFAGIDVFVDFVSPAPVYVTTAPVHVVPAPVYVAPAVYRHGEPRRHARHERFERRHHRGFRGHHGHHDYRGRH